MSQTEGRAEAMKFSEVLTLRRVEREKRPDGTFSSEDVDREVFFNRYRVGLESRLAGAREGLYGVVEGQVRSSEYLGEQMALLDGREYTVAGVSDQGEYTVLTLSERLSNG